jgi:Chs5-Arf1p-binding protein BUD7/BCH1
MEEEYRIEKGKPVESPLSPNGHPSDSQDRKSTSSSLDPMPPTPSSPRPPNGPLPNEIEIPPNSAEATNQNPSKLQSKRLCERWLDNLFMVLYEDLRVYTLWRAEMEHFAKQQLQFQKTNAEWEMLGELALRLHHKVIPPLRINRVARSRRILSSMFGYWI